MRKYRSFAEEKKRRKRWIITAAVVALVALFLWLFWYYFFAQLFVKHGDLLPPDQGTSGVSGPQNILLVGSDSRDPKDIRDNARSDVIQLVHLDADHRVASIIHFPRDMYVEIPCGPKHCAGRAPADNRAKINAAYAWGGSPLLVLTLEKLLGGAKINHVIQIGFNGFAVITDDIGGVDIDVDQAFNEPPYGVWSVGVHHMTGQQALMYVRERHQLRAGDIDRGRDQQAWMRAILKRLWDTNALRDPIKLTQLMQDGLNNATVDQHLTVADMRTLAGDIAKHDFHLTTFTAPWSGFGSVPGVGSTVTVDQYTMNWLGYCLRTDNMPIYQRGPIKGDPGYSPTGKANWNSGGLTK